MLLNCTIVAYEEVYQLDHNVIAWIDDDTVILRADETYPQLEVHTYHRSSAVTLDQQVVDNYWLTIN